MNGKKVVCNLKPGDVIPPPAGERKWLWRDGVRRMMTVLDVSDGMPDKNGPWLRVKVRYPSPYAPQDGETVCRMRPESVVTVQAP